MLRSEAARYARWSAAVALVLAAITTIVYLERGREAWIQKKKAPPPAAVDVSRQSAGITFKRNDQNRTIFEVSASKSTDFKGQDASLLEDVKITVYGKTGERHDVIHTQSCRYGKESGGIDCNGDVQIDLESAQDAKLIADHPELAKTRATHIETRGVHFNRTSGLAQTDQQVTFAFPSGEGSAVGLEYKSEEGLVRLLRDVRFRLVPAQPPANKPERNRSGASSIPQEVRVKGSALEFGRDMRQMRLFGPTEAETPAQRLSAQEMDLFLDQEFRAERLIARGGNSARPTLSSRQGKDQLKIEADALVARFSPEGAVLKLEASGAMHAIRNGTAEVDDAKADAGVLELWPGLNEPKELNLHGNVVLVTQAAKSGDSRTLQTSGLRVDFGSGKKGEAAKIQRAETLAAGSMEWTDAAQPNAALAKTKLSADKLALGFGDEGKPRQLVATDNVHAERIITGRPVQTASARNGVAELQPSGGWSQMDLQGDVVLKEADRSGQGDHAVFVRAAQTATLTGNAVARDASTETHAPRITFAQASGEIHADGGVRSTDISSRASAVQLAPAPINVTADTLQANSKTGRAFYTGHARLWQGDAVMEAQSIELLRQSKTLNASGNVRAVFPQAPRAQSATNAVERNSALTPAVTPLPRNAAETKTAAKKTQLWHATCGTLSYQESENRAHLEQNVFLQSAEQKMRAPVLDLYFTRAAVSGQAIGSAANPAGGSQQISRAFGSGGVVVEEGNRKAVAERGEYVAAAGKFTMSGGSPTLYDGSAGTTTGRQLTFFLADDTIIVDSENGSRIVTKHRVEK